MYKYIEAPDDWGLNKLGILYPHESIFLAGSITGAADWQANATKLLLPHYNVFNPRRKNYISLDPSVEEEQISWEWNALNFCKKIIFWFSYETLAPITLFEYGKMLAFMNEGWNKLYVGVHPDYKRKNDVFIQSRLEGYTEISNNLEEVINRAISAKNG